MKDDDTGEEFRFFYERQIDCEERETLVELPVIRPDIPPREGTMTPWFVRGLEHLECA